MVRYQTSQKQFGLPNLQSVTRISNIPVVETGWNYAENIYNKIKKSNNLFYWTFGQAESSFHAVLGTALPAFALLEGPILVVDKLVCKSLDIVEQKVPQIHLPPQMIYWNTKQYVSDVGTKLVRPVLKRADSVKQIGNSVLASKYTAFAADRLDGALNVADMYVDKYLPADAFDDQVTEEIKTSKPVDGPAGKAIQTIQHVDRFSRKLQRRLTRRTLAEAKALKEHSAEAIHVLVYVAELIATDPKMAWQKGRELWASLSKDEPENQARPENLEQLIVMLTRESTRRIVHFINFTSAAIVKLPKRFTHTFLKLSSACLEMAESILKTVHLEGVQEAVLDTFKIASQKSAKILSNLNSPTTVLLEQFALYINHQEQQKQTATAVPTKVRNPNNQIRSSRDTLYPPASPKTHLKATHRHVNNTNVNVINGVESN